MKEKENIESKIRYFRIVDILVVIIFLSTAAFSIYLFRADLMKTIGARDEDPVGLIIIKNNVVQRRFEDRVLWERLFVDSPVYSGDLIRAADLSAASIHIDENQLNINQNTLIRIQHSNDGRGTFNIDLREGNISVATGESGSGIVLSVAGREIRAAEGSVLNAELGDEGMVVSVSEGSAVFLDELQSKIELVKGMLFAQDSSGTEIKIKAAVMISPQNNARYIKSGTMPVAVDFEWNRINLEDSEMLRMEIAQDQNFTRNFRSANGLNSYAQIFFTAGGWYWRLMYEDLCLSSGELSVIDGSAPQLFSPAAKSVFRFRNEPPQIRFQWAQTSGASHYIIEICGDESFSNPKIKTQVLSASFVQSELKEGDWYWRVQPVFSSAYIGSAGVSSIGLFKIEQTADINIPSVVLPEPPKRYYTVQGGDTLGRIAGRFYGNPLLWNILIAPNGIRNPDYIEIGDVLVIP
ncbi:MAG: LysM peptidoglycan-binding domain-containing protein [Treponema sp.]|nr:LysM peptidoglycan-binding domain-containing protein [Treponema sp.]